MKCKLPKGTSIYVNAESHWSIVSNRDIEVDDNKDSLLSLGYENLVRLQFSKPINYNGTLVYTIDFQSDELVRS